MNHQPKTKARHLLVAAGVSSVLLGCASTPGARPEDMSAQAHEEEAAKHAQVAQEHDAEYDPNATRTNVGGGVTSGSDFPAYEADYNPTEGHRVAAERHRKHAADHAAAAEALARSEEDACKSIAPASRASCPLLGPVVAVEDIPTGVRISLRKGTDVEAFVEHVRCHLAFANTRGREGMDHCPLYLPGIQVRRVGTLVVELSALDQANVLLLQQRVANYVAE